MTQRQVKIVIGSMKQTIHEQIACSEPINLFGLMKIQVKKKAARPECEKINPFKPNEVLHVKAKPESKKIRIVPLKPLKDML